MEGVEGGGAGHTADLVMRAGGGVGHNMLVTTRGNHLDTNC